MPDAGTASAADAGALREAVLSGETPDGTGLRRFLGEEPGALRAWFGDAAAGGLRGDAMRCRLLLDRDIAVLDTLIAVQLDAVLHHPRLQRLEGSWRGLAWLVAGMDPGSPLRVRVLSVSWGELERDFARAIEFDQSALFRLVYESEFGMAGGEPFGLLVVDHEVSHQTLPRGLASGAPVDDISVLAGLAALAAAAFAPVVVAASPALLGVDRFGDLALSQDPAACLADGEHARWRQLAAREDARFLCITLPRVLARAPWRRDPAMPGLLYEEHVARAEHHSWSVACYAFASCVVRAQEAFGWAADVRGVATGRIGGGLVPDLPGAPFRLGAATVWPRQSLDLAFTDGQERDLVEAGLMPLNTLPFGEAAFTAVRSLQARRMEAPGRRPTPAAANAQISAQIGTMLCVSRFAHMLKVMGRELGGAFATPAEIERRLQRWLAQYTNATQGADPDSRARYPLVASRVEVRDLPGRPGSFGCVIHLQPFYQIDDVSASFRLVTGFAAAHERGATA